MDTAGETAGTARQAGQIVTQLGIIGFDRVGLGFAGRDVVPTRIVDQAVVGFQGVTEVGLSLRSIIQQRLHHLIAAFRAHPPAEDTARGAFDEGDDVDPLFFCSTKVYNSSSSTVSTCSGKGAAGSWAA